MLKNDINHFYETTALLEQSRFAELFLATLAYKTSIIYFYKTNKKMAQLPSDFKKTIETIMFCENGWGIRFSTLLDSEKYYKNQYGWENDFSNAISTYLKGKNKSIEYDFFHDAVLIQFTDQEISEIRSLYDEDILGIVDHFVSLVQNFSENRSHDLLGKESEREIHKQYIRTGPYTWSK